MMHCPSCIVEFKIAERHGVEIDYCPECRGVWLDRGELDKIIERASAEAPSRGRTEEEQSYRRERDDGSLCSETSPTQVFSGRLI